MKENEATANNGLQLSRVASRRDNKNQAKVNNRQKQAANNSKTPQKPKAPRPTRRTNLHVSEWLQDTTANILGATSFASERFGIEDNFRNRQPVLIQVGERLLSRGALSQNAAARLGYGAAISDLVNLRINQFYYLILWTSGDNTTEVINRAAGSNYSHYLNKVKDGEQFERGYQTAVGQFVIAIVGDQQDDSNHEAFLPVIMKKITQLSTEQQQDLTSRWFQHFDHQLNGQNPERPVAANDEATGKFLRRETNHSFLSSYHLPNQATTWLETFSYQGPDYTDVLDRELKQKLDFQDLTSLTSVVDRFVNQTLMQIVNLVVPLSLYDVIYQLANNGRNWLGVPVTMSTEPSEVETVVALKYPEMMNRLRRPKSIASASARLGILNLAKGHEISVQHPDLQAKFSFARDVRGNQMYNDITGEPLVVRYGIIEKLFLAWQKALLLPVLSEYTLARNRLLVQISSGEYTKSRNVLKPDLAKEQSLAEIVDQAASYALDQSIGLVAKGEFDYEQNMAVKTLPEFNQMMRLAPSDRNLGGDNYQLLLKQTRVVYFWLYQSSFADQLTPAQRAHVENKTSQFSGDDVNLVNDLFQKVKTVAQPMPIELEDPIKVTPSPVMQVVKSQVNNTKQLTEQVVTNVANVTTMAMQQSLSETKQNYLSEQLARAQQADQQAEELLAGLQHLLAGVNQNDLVEITQVTNQLQQSATMALAKANEIFYPSVPTQVETPFVAASSMKMTSLTPHKQAQLNPLQTKLDEAEELIDDARNLQARVRSLISDTESVRDYNHEENLEDYASVNHILNDLKEQQDHLSQLITSGQQASAEAHLAIDSQQQDTANASIEEILALKPRLNNLSQAVDADDEKLAFYR